MKFEKHESYILALLEENERWSGLGLKAVTSLNTDKVILPAKIYMNGESQIIYPIDGLTGLNVSSSFAKDMAEVVAAIDESEFLERSYLQISGEYLFSDAKENSTRFMVVPVVRDDAKDKELENAAWENQCKEIVDKMTGKDAFESIDDFFGAMQAEKSCDMQRAPIHLDSSELVLRYQGDYGHFALYDSTDIFRIGNSVDVEGTITINPSISRLHCVIVRENGEYFIEDDHSRNGTYMYGKRLQNGEKIRLKNGDTIKLSDMEFAVEIR
ncbi:FHA domain-containing protein [Butyrivibrio hungatei DSM 14810]|uniref:FHA domain-containing protein n=1 Tax=Butyrivibrio hungatei DSM 14810 TaxID=1121132 RepID=A0A1M7RS82_9FIRM|nr:FHA domain-containing protein [Butyrivibrio hungatei]SHN48982.1 FHA domain-containing protein [Butyrivibrio hungatei DSM 14810]